MTATTVTIGNIISKSNFFDAKAFLGPYNGAKAFFDALNKQGGINGRRVVFITCDDSGSASINVECARKLVDRDHVFALVSNGVLNYGGAGYLQSKGVPDVGSQPVDTAYYRYSHLWDIAGEGYPRNGTVGYDGVLTSGTEVYRYIRSAHPKVPAIAGIVYYNQSASQRYGAAIARGLKLEGFRTISEQVNFALPDFDSVAIAMKQAQVNYVFDALDRVGNERLCLAMDDNRLPVTAKVTTTQSWEGSVGSDYAGSPQCRNSIIATGTALNYEDTKFPQVASFRAGMQADGLNTPSALSEWALEGWAGAMWFADAARSCGADLTRKCVEKYLARPTSYDARGLLTPRDFVVSSLRRNTTLNCLNVAQWQDAANAGRGGWVTRVPDMNTNCFLVPVYNYRP